MIGLKVHACSCQPERHSDKSYITKKHVVNSFIYGISGAWFVIGLSF